MKYNHVGNTSVIQVAPIAFLADTATSAVRGLELLHFLCKNRKYCINGSLQPTAALTFTIGEIVDLGTGYAVKVRFQGTLTYMPYRNTGGYGQGCGCGDNCPAQDPLFGEIVLYSTTNVGLAITSSDVIDVVPANVQDCCNATNAVRLLTQITLTNTPA